MRPPIVWTDTPNPTDHTHIHTSISINQIEYGIKRMLGAVDEKVPVITTIRDEQLVPGLVPKGESVLQHDVRTFDGFSWLVVQVILHQLLTSTPACFHRPLYFRCRSTSS